jgi:hypothetical protein
MPLHHQTSRPLLENAVFSVWSMLRLYIAKPIRKSILVPGVEAGLNTFTIALQVVATKFLGDINAGTWPSSLGESRIRDG